MIVRWTQPATDDLEAAYLAVAAYNVGAADRLYERITEATSLLAQWPHAGRPGIVPETRELVVSGTNYLAVYELQAGLSLSFA